MCYAVTCSICGKTTWAGCGMHVDRVMRKVPSDQRCPGHPAGGGTTSRAAAPTTASTEASTAASATPSRERGFLSRILGR